MVVVKTIPIEVSDGVLRLPGKTQLPERSYLAVMVIEEMLDVRVDAIAEGSGAFEFLLSEPELYSDADILPDRRNPRFGAFS